MGVNLHRRAMSRLTIRVCEKWLEPIYQRIYEELLGCKVFHMDETRIQRNKEPGKAPSSDLHMWVMCSGRSEERQAGSILPVRQKPQPGDSQESAVGLPRLPDDRCL